MIKTLSLVSILALGILAGCASDANATDTSSTPSTTGSTVSTAEKVKCSGCDQEFPKAELASHDGGLMCKHCIAAHNH